MKLPQKVPTVGLSEGIPDIKVNVDIQRVLTQNHKRHPRLSKTKHINVQS